MNATKGVEGEDPLSLQRRVFGIGRVSRLLRQERSRGDGSGDGFREELCGGLITKSFEDAAVHNLEPGLQFDGREGGGGGHRDNEPQEELAIHTTGLVTRCNCRFHR